MSNLPVRSNSTLTWKEDVRFPKEPDKFWVEVGSESLPTYRLCL